MKHVPFALTLLVISVSPQQSLAQQQAVEEEVLVCDSIYMVQPGDSLSSIALEIYGRLSAYQAIFDYNPGLLSDPDQLPSSVGLYIPCLDGSAVEAEPLPELPEARANALKILTGSEYPPYVDEGLPNGGFSVELVERALLENDGANDYRIDVINDWAAHLEPLLADGAYNLAFPWFRPDCSERERLGESSLWRCDNLRFSDALHDVVVMFHVRPETAEAIGSPEDVEGMTLCRPRGYFTHDLEAMGLAPPAIERVAADDPEECFELLADGEVDVVSVNADTADRVLSELGLQDAVAELTDLATVQTLHVVAMRTDPEARVNLLRIDKGLRLLHNSGTYRQIADVHLSQ